MSIVVLSPHLDDAILSIAGTLHRLHQSGLVIRVVTLFAGDPERQGPPSAWDAARRLPTASEVFAARRTEDLEASAALGVEPVHLDHADDGYLGARDPDAMWEELSPHVDAAAAVFVPGAPLAHSDHLYTTMLALERLDRRVPLLFYAEQPYSYRPRYLMSFVRGRTPRALRHAVGGDLVWQTIRLHDDTRATKASAVRHYVGELKALGMRARLDSVMERLLPIEKIAHAPGTCLPECVRRAL